MLARRLATAAVGIPVAVVTVWLGGWVMTAVVAAVVAVGAWEFYRLAGQAGYAPATAVGLVATALLPVTASAGPARWTVGLVVALVLAALSAELVSRRERALANAAGTALGALYVGLLGSHWVLLRSLPEGMALTFLVVAGTWCADSAAYFVGRSFGRRKLAPEVSPNKTVEGAVGAVVGGIVGAVAVAAWFALPAAWAVAGGLLCAVCGQLGDLWESRLKREAQAKDSGNLLPGHGGVLDRFDGLLFSGAVAYYVFGWWTGSL
jgi:phosphatidate cytidylyltransferase